MLFAQLFHFLRIGFFPGQSVFLIIASYDQKRKISFTKMLLIK